MTDTAPGDAVGMHAGTVGDVEVVGTHNRAKRDRAMANRAIVATACGREQDAAAILALLQDNLPFGKRLLWLGIVGRVPTVCECVGQSLDEQTTRVSCWETAGAW